ncbi:MAG: porphobilinogen synthase [Thermoleophilia bacterium]
MSGYPAVRLRRFRRTAALRALVRETHLEPGQLVYPVFACPGEGVRRPLEGLPGIVQLSVDEVVEEGRELVERGIGAVLVFGLPEQKDEIGSEAYADEGIVQRTVRALKAEVPGLVVMTDVCLCAYTTHGHCGLVREGEILNDLSIEVIARAALSHAEAGADVVAPSDMMDGRVAAIRGILDDEGHENVAILSYAAKFASSFYGPFREAADSTPAFGDRRSYQMDGANPREALREVALDLEEGADAVIVKPSLAYLDVITRVRDRFDVPVAAYNVSGEYGMVRAAAAKGWLDERQAALESLVAMRRAGADVIITYWAKDAAKWLA